MSESRPEPGRSQELDDYFERIGDRFDAWMSDYDVHRRAILVRKHLADRAAGLRCLEIGCGTGAISEAVKDRVGALTVADVSGKLARGVGERLGVAWLQQDACALTLPDRSFDVVISSECVEHTPDPRKALREMARVLTPGGLLVVTTPNKLWYPVIWLAMITGARNFAGRENWLFPGQAVRTLAQAGLTELKLDGCHLLPWQIPGVKRILPLLDRWGETVHPLMINFCVVGRKAAS